MELHISHKREVTEISIMVYYRDAISFELRALRVH